MPRCRDCTLYDLEAVQSKSGAVLSSRSGQCLWVSTEVYPVSVHGHMRRVTAGWMAPNKQHRCPRFIKREPT